MPPMAYHSSSVETVYGGGDGTSRRPQLVAADSGRRLDVDVDEDGRSGGSYAGDFYRGGGLSLRRAGSLLDGNDDEDDRHDDGNGKDAATTAQTYGRVQSWPRQSNPHLIPHDDYDYRQRQQRGQQMGYSDEQERQRGPQHHRNGRRPSKKPSKRRPKSIMKKRSRLQRPPSPQEAMPHLLGGCIYDDDEDHDEHMQMQCPPSPTPSVEMEYNYNYGHSTSPLGGVSDLANISFDDGDGNLRPDEESLDEEDDSTENSFWSMMADNACMAPCNGVQWKDDVVTETWTRPRTRRDEMSTFYYQRSDYRDFKLQYKLCGGVYPDEEEEDDREKVAQTVSPSSMQCDPSSSSSSSPQAFSLDCGASDAFWDCLAPPGYSASTSASSEAEAEATAMAAWRRSGGGPVEV